MSDINNTPPPAHHRYPSLHGPGTHWATDEAWAILDALPPGQLTDDQRFLTAGHIARALLWRAACGPPAPTETDHD